MIACTRKLDFCSGHRVYGHESKCAHLHGHNYTALVTASAPLDSIGRVIDFSVIKEKLGSWIDTHWDHGFILWDKDVEARDAVLSVAPSKLFLLPSNPTAENLASYLLDVVSPSLFSDVHISEVTLWETPNCYATAKVSS